MQCTNDWIFPLQINKGLLTVNTSRETAGVINHTTINKCLNIYIFRHIHILSFSHTHAYFQNHEACKLTWKQDKVDDLCPGQLVIQSNNRSSRQMGVFQTQYGIRGRQVYRITNIKWLGLNKSMFWSSKCIFCLFVHLFN